MNTSSIPHITSTSGRKPTSAAERLLAVATQLITMGPAQQVAPRKRHMEVQEEGPSSHGKLILKIKRTPNPIFNSGDKRPHTKKPMVDEYDQSTLSALLLNEQLEADYAQQKTRELHSELQMVKREAIQYFTALEDQVMLEQDRTTRARNSLDNERRFHGMTVRELNEVKRLLEQTKVKNFSLMNTINDLSQGRLLTVENDRDHGQQQAQIELVEARARIDQLTQQRDVSLNNVHHLRYTVESLKAEIISMKDHIKTLEQQLWRRDTVTNAHLHIMDTFKEDCRRAQEEANTARQDLAELKAACQEVVNEMAFDVDTCCERGPGCCADWAIKQMVLVVGKYDQPDIICLDQEPSTSAN